MKKDNSQQSMPTDSRSKWHIWEFIGVLLVTGLLIILLLTPNSLSQLFDMIIKEVKPVVVDIFLTSEIGIPLL